MIYWTPSRKIWTKNCENAKHCIPRKRRFAPMQTGCHYLYTAVSCTFGCFSLKRHLFSIYVSKEKIIRYRHTKLGSNPIITTGYPSPKRHIFFVTKQMWVKRMKFPCRKHSLLIIMKFYRKREQKRKYGMVIKKNEAKLAFNNFATTIHHI